MSLLGGRSLGTCPNDGCELVQHERGILHCPVCSFNVPLNTKILEGLYAWLSVDSEGREGFMASQLPGSSAVMVLCHSERHKIEELRKTAMNAVNGLPGYSARLVHFTKREVLE